MRKALSFLISGRIDSPMELFSAREALAHPSPTPPIVSLHTGVVFPSSLSQTCSDDDPLLPTIGQHGKPPSFFLPPVATDPTNFTVHPLQREWRPTYRLLRALSKLSFFYGGTLKTAPCICSRVKRVGTPADGPDVLWA